jgi:hypothetical protein
MVTVETISRIGRAFWVDKKPIRQIVRAVRISRQTVRKAIRGSSTEFHYERQIQPQPRLGGAAQPKRWMRRALAKPIVSAAAKASVGFAICSTTLRAAAAPLCG